MVQEGGQCVNFELFLVSQIYDETFLIEVLLKRFCHDWLLIDNVESRVTQNNSLTKWNIFPYNTDFIKKILEVT